MPALLIEFIAAVGSAIGGVGGATLIMYAEGIATALIYGAVLVYGVTSSQSAARRAARNAKNAYNSSLTDRMTTLSGADVPWQIIYGEAVVAPLMVPAILTSGDKDQYKHVVAVWAAHECDSITDFMLGGVSVGTLDSDGYPTGGKWLKAGTETQSFIGTFSAGGTLTLPTEYYGHVEAVPVRIVAITDATVGESPSMIGPSEVTLVDHTITLHSDQMAYWASRAVVVSYDNGVGSPLIRVRHYLGTATQTADGPTMTDCPADWTASDRGLGICYSIIRFDLNEPEFQGGPMLMTARIKGHKLYDHRTGTTVWSDTAALCISDFLQAEYGKQALTTQMDLPSVDATANVCDEALSSHGGAKRYTVNGAFRTDASPDATLDQLCQAMGGFVTYTGAWHLQAGAYTAPVMDLTDADNRGGGVEIVAAPQGAEVFNGMRGKFFDPARYDQLTDYTPYQNAAFVSEDGEALWSDQTLPFTNTNWRAHNLVRIQVERSRGMQLVYPSKRRALSRKAGQRIRLSNSVLGFEASVFRVVKREYKIGGAVNLTLAQDDASYYDEVDAPGSLASPAVHLKDPFVVDAVAGLAVTSGTATLLQLADGTILSRIKVVVTASTDALVTSNGALQIEYRRDSDAVWQRAPDAGGAGTVAYLLGQDEGFVYIVRARWVNGLGAVGDWRSKAVLHLGKLEAPAAITGFALALIPGAMKGTCVRTIEPDYSYTIYRYGVSFSAGVKVPGTSDANGFVWPWPAAGAYTVWAADVDTSGHVGTPVSQTITVDSSILIGAGSASGAVLNNLIDTTWWQQDASLLWGTNGEYNRLIGISPVSGGVLTLAGPKGGNDVVWYCAETTGDGGRGGGWENVPISLDPSKAYRFVLPIRRLNGAAGYMYWGTQNIEMLDGSANGNPYFAETRPAYADRWYLFIGYIYPAGSAGNTSESAGVWDCKTGEKIATGYNFRFKAGDGNVFHRAYQYYASNLADQVFGRPTVNLVDGTEPSLREYFEPGAVLNSTLIPSITAAQSAADAAQGTATTAAGNATSALSTLATMRSNGYLDASEKPDLIRRWQSISDEKPGIYAQGGSYGITTERSAYSTAYDNLASYLTGLSPSWSDTTTDTPITPATDQATWAAYYGARQTLLNKIAEVAGTVAIWSGVGGSGKPLDNAGKTVDLGGATGVFGARNRDDLPSEYPWGRSLQFKQASSIGLSSADGTYCTLETLIQYVDDSGGPNVQYAYQGSKTWRRTALRTAGAWGSWTQDLDRNAYTGDLAATQNEVVYSSTAPSSPTNRTLWIDTSVTPRTIKIWSGSSWLLAGTYVNGTAQITDDANLGLTALWTGVTGSAKPADYATRNPVYYTDTDPGSVPDGSIWISSTKAWQRVSGAWQPYVGTGSVNTNELASAAVHTIAVFTATGWSYSGGSG
jgi:hypothetical protein